MARPRPGWAGPLLGAAVTLALLCLGAANVALRASWHEAEDGVLWVSRPQGLVAEEVAPDTAAAHAGLRPGDVLVAIEGHPVTSPADVVEHFHSQRSGSRLDYVVLRLGSQEFLELTLTPVPSGRRALYFVQAALGIFTLLVGTSVRLRRPGDQATLHFYWLCVAFFGAFTFSLSGRLDRLDWIFYWADAVAILLLPPLFVHFVLVFPERTNRFGSKPLGRLFLPVLYAPAIALGAARIAVLVGEAAGGPRFTERLEGLDRLELAYLAVCLLGGLAILIRALKRVRSVTARRQLRWIVLGTTVGALPFVLGYVLPYASGVEPLPRMELLVIPLGLVPLAFASAIVRYRLMDVEVIIKRGLVSAAAIAVIAGIYALLLRLAGAVFLGGPQQLNTVIAVLATLVVVLLAPTLKSLIQTTLDRAYYRDRYDYRRALVAFARDLNSDLDLDRLSERLVARVMETLVVERMALMLAPAYGTEGDFTAIRAEGFDVAVPPLSVASSIGARLQNGHAVSLDDPLAAHRFQVGEIQHWRDHGLQTFVPCVSKDRTIAVMALGGKVTGEPLSSEDAALLAAVAGQVATALENGRLYRQLDLKASELARLREFSENIIESLDDGLVAVDLEDRVLRWNRGLERISGVSAGAALGQPLDALFDPRFLERLRAARREGEGSGALYRLPLASRHPDGPHRLLVNVSIAPLKTPGGSTTGTMILIENITSRVQLEEQLQISEKMASIGLLAAGVAHEVNTPLTGISSFTQMLLESATPEDPRTRLLEKIERQSFRAAKIVNALLNLARPSQVDTGPVDLNAVVNDVLSLLEHQFAAGRIQVRKDLSPVSPIVRGIEHKLQQVLLNLLLNARDAMPKGGWLTVETRASDGRAVIEVGDTGSGIPAEHLSQIYDPFFTTKAMGQGTGLGLSITYGIIQEHGGSITCDSTPGQGTRFTVALPLASAAREARPDQVASTS